MATATVPLVDHLSRWSSRGNVWADGRPSVGGLEAACPVEQGCGDLWNRLVLGLRPAHELSKCLSIRQTEPVLKECAGSA